MLNLPAMKPLSERTETFTDSVIRRMTRIANACGAINLSQGFPDFFLSSANAVRTEPQIISAARQTAMQRTNLFFMISALGTSVYGIFL